VYTIPPQSHNFLYYAAYILAVDVAASTYTQLKKSQHSKENQAEKSSPNTLAW